MSSIFTNGVNYSLKPTSVRCHRKTVVIPASNKTSFSPQETSIFYVPSLKNHVMDGKSGYIRFKATITGAGRLDVSAHSFTDRLMTFGAGGSLISDIQAYRGIATEMLDLQLSQSEKVGLSPMLGTEDSIYFPSYSWYSNYCCWSYSSSVGRSTTERQSFRSGSCWRCYLLFCYSSCFFTLYFRSLRRCGHILLWLMILVSN